MPDDSINYFVPVFQLAEEEGRGEINKKGREKTGRRRDRRTQNISRGKKEVIKISLPSNV